MTSELKEETNQMLNGNTVDDDNCNISKETDENEALELEVIFQGFKECLSDDELIIDGYIRAYTEITKIINSLGSVFGFVSRDVHSKLNILRCYRKGGASIYYNSIQSMLEYEDHNDEINPSGSRTLLRLHRALAFIKGFLEVVAQADLDSNLGPLVQPVYAKTLAKYHGWLISKAVSAALLLLPSKRNFLLKMVGPNEAKQQHFHSRSPEMCSLIDKVYQGTEDFYSQHQKLDLP